MARGVELGEVFVGALIAVFVGILVAVALTPGITSGVNSLTSGATPQVTGTPATLFGNVVLFLALGVMLFVVGFALLFLRHRGSRAFDYAKSIRNRPIHNSTDYNYDNTSPFMQT